MGILANRTNKNQVKRLEEQVSFLREQLAEDARSYLTSISFLESDIERLKNELDLAKTGKEDK